MLDNTARIYSRFNGKAYNDCFAEINVYYEEDFLLACNSYRLMLPVKSRRKGNLNIFELTLLRLFKLHYWSNDVLAARIGMELDFISFLVQSLQERGFLADNGLLTEKGETELSGAMSTDDDESNVEYITARIFAMKKSGELLPVICLDEKDIKTGDVDRNNKLIRMTLGSSAGTERNQSLKYLSSGRGDKDRPKPTRTQVLKLLQDFNRICSYKDDSMIRLYGTQLNVEYAEDVFLHMKTILQRDDVTTLIVSDGFVSNNSIVLDYFKQEKELHFFDRVYARAMSLQEKVATGEVKQRDKYYEINKFLKEIPLKGNTYEERQQADRVNRRVVRNLFAALEWTLHFYLRQHPLSPVVQRAIIGQSGAENKRLALDAAKRLGFNLSDALKDRAEMLFSQVYGYRLTQYFNSIEPSPNLDVLLPLCMIQAGNDSKSPWHKIVQEFPGLFGVKRNAQKYDEENPLEDAEPFKDEQQDLENLTSQQIEELKKQKQRLMDDQREENLIENCYFDLVLLREYAKKNRHNVEEVHVTYVKAMGWYRKVEKLIRLLIPDYAKGTKASKTVDDYATQMIADINSLSKWFSPLELQKFNPSLCREILSVAPSRDNTAVFSDTEMILSLSIVLEHYFKERVYLLDISISARKTMTDAVRSIVNKLEGLKIPEYLNTINQKYYTAALEGRPATLGGYALVWGGHVDEDVYTGTGLLEILELVGEVTRLRVHGNEISLNQNKEELLELRDRVFDVIRRMED